MADISRMTTRRGRSLHTFEAFSNHSYRLLWTANFFAYISRWMQMTLLGWFVLELTSSPLRVALVGFFGMLPLLMLGMIGGVLADRVNRHRLLIIVQIGSFIAALAITALLQTDMVRFWHAYVVIFATGVGWALDMPSRRSVVHDLVGRSRVTNAIALDSVGMHASRMIGPALAGGLIAIVDVKGAYMVVSSLLVVAVALIWAVSLPQQGSRGLASSNVIRNLVEGLRYVRSNNALLGTVLVTILMNLLLFPYVQMIPVIARDVLHIGAGLMGTLLAVEGLGALTGAVIIASKGDIRYHGRYYMGGSMIGLVMVLLFSLSHSYLMSLPILLVLGLGTSGFGTMQATIVMLQAKDEMRGRALGVISLAIGAGPLGALMIGAIASVTDASFAIGIHAVLGIASLSLVALMMPSLRRQTAPDATDPEPEDGVPQSARAVP